MSAVIDYTHPVRSAVAQKADRYGVPADVRRHALSIALSDLKQGRTRGVAISDAYRYIRGVGGRRDAGDAA